MHLGDVYAGKSKDKELSDLRKENKTLTNKVLSLEGKLRTKGTGSGYRDREKEESLKKKFGDKATKIAELADILTLQKVVQHKIVRTYTSALRVSVTMCSDGAKRSIF